MPHLSDLTLEQMRALTRNQLLDNVRSWLSANFTTKRALIRFLLDIEREQRDDELTYYPDGQPKRARVTYYDLETEVMTGRMIINWDYYDNGDIKHITFSVRDAGNNEIERYRIVHPRSGTPFLEVLPL